MDFIIIPRVPSEVPIRKKKEVISRRSVGFASSPFVFFSGKTDWEIESSHRNYSLIFRSWGLRLDETENPRGPLILEKSEPAVKPVLFAPRMLRVGAWRLWGFHHTQWVLQCLPSFECRPQLLLLQHSLPQQRNSPKELLKVIYFFQGRLKIGLDVIHRLPTASDSFRKLY